MSKEDNNKGEEFKLERYKYVLQQLNSLNENHHKYLTLYQTLATAVIGGGIFIFISWKELKIDAATARLGIRGLLGLLIILTLFVSISIVAGILSWFDYRKEEVEILRKEVGPGFRHPPSIKNIWRWSEVYLIAFLIAVMISIYIFAEYKLIPSVQ